MKLLLVTSVLLLAPLATADPLEVSTEPDEDQCVGGGRSYARAESSEAISEHEYKNCQFVVSPDHVCKGYSYEYHYTAHKDTQGNWTYSQSESENEGTCVDVPGDWNEPDPEEIAEMIANELP